MAMEDLDDTDVDESERWSDEISISWTGSAENVPVGYADATYQIQTSIDDGDNWVDATYSDDNDVDGETDGTIGVPADSDGGFQVRIVATAENDGDVDPQHNTALTLTSDPVEVTEVDPSATGVTARRQAAADSDEADAGGDFIQASWSAMTNSNSDFRMIVEVTPASVGNTVWVVLQGTIDATDRSAVSAAIDNNYSGSLPVALESGEGSSVTVTAADLRKAINVAIESVQGTADDTKDGPKWKRSDPKKPVDAKTGS